MKSLNELENFFMREGLMLMKNYNRKGYSFTPQRFWYGSMIGNNYVDGNKSLCYRFEGGKPIEQIVYTLKELRQLWFDFDKVKLLM